MEITEDLYYKFDGEYNGGYRDLKLSNNASASEPFSYDVLSAGEVSDSGDYLDYARNDNASKGDSKAYSVESTDTGLRVKFFLPSTDVTRHFRLKYVVKKSGLFDTTM